MALTRSFRETVKARAERDPAFRAALLQEAIETMLSGDFEIGKSILRDYVNATVGFETLAAETKKNPKSLMRMLSPSGNPRADNLFDMIACLQEREGVRFEMKRAKERA
jgi:DNA-binding phage protein